MKNCLKTKDTEYLRPACAPVCGQSRAQRLLVALREGDTVARQGGDEFVLVLANQPSEESIRRTVQRVLHEVSKPWAINGAERQITCSLGISVHPADGSEVDVLLKNADSTMYRAKELGRNNFQYFGADMNTGVSGRLDLLTRLRGALVRNEFLLH